MRGKLVNAAILFLSAFVGLAAVGFVFVIAGWVSISLGLSIVPAALVALAFTASLSCALGSLLWPWIDAPHILFSGPIARPLVGSAKAFVVVFASVGILIGVAVAIDVVGAAFGAPPIIRVAVGFPTIIALGFALFLFWAEVIK